MKEKVREVPFYVCAYCDSVFDTRDMAEIHTYECLHNYDDVHGCTSCKFAEINLVAPTDNDNGYKSLRLQNMIGVKAYLTCGKKHYSGKLNEELILREDKSCYEQMDEGDRFIVVKTPSYERYKKLMLQADIEQAEIDADIKEYWDYVRALDEDGLSLEEIRDKVRERYSDETNH